MKFFKTVVLLSKDGFQIGHLKRTMKHWERSESEMKLLEGPVEEKVLGTVWTHNDDVFWVQSKSSRGYQINEESNIKPSSSDLRSPWNRRSLPD